jgi:hypothetical protein
MWSGLLNDSYNIAVTRDIDERETASGTESGITDTGKRIERL